MTRPWRVLEAKQPQVKPPTGSVLGRTFELRGTERISGKEGRAAATFAAQALACPHNSSCVIENAWISFLHTRNPPYQLLPTIGLEGNHLYILWWSVPTDSLCIVYHRQCLSGDWNRPSAYLCARNTSAHPKSKSMRNPTGGRMRDFPFLHEELFVAAAQRE